MVSCPAETTVKSRQIGGIQFVNYIIVENKSTEYYKVSMDLFSGGHLNRCGIE